MEMESRCFYDKSTKKSGYLLLPPTSFMSPCKSRCSPDKSQIRNISCSDLLVFFFSNSQIHTIISNVTNYLNFIVRSLQVIKHGKPLLYKMNSYFGNKNSTQLSEKERLHLSSKYNGLRS